MKQLHWLIVALIAIMLIGLPVWYASNGIGAQTLAVSSVISSGGNDSSGTARRLRSSGNRSIIGGGRRYGK